jgi:2',3'-cyclic-nucleotide 2'-phosphodiesterase (5'-nucleotidase family)
MNKDGKPVYVSQTGTKFANVGKLVIRPDGKMFTELVKMEDIPYLDRNVRMATDSIMSVLSVQTSRPICQNDVDLKILDAEGRQQVRYAETNVGDLVADSYRIITGADFAMTNGGGIRVDLPKGQLTYGDLITLMPFENHICMVDITGAQLKDLLEDCTKHTPVEFGDFPQVSGIKFTIDKRRTEGDRITDMVILNKTGNYEPVVMDRTYNLATIDYCVTGGGFVGKLKQNRVSKPNIMVYNECLIKYVTENLKGHIGSEYAAPQGRIKIVEK